MSPGGADDGDGADGSSGQGGQEDQVAEQDGPWEVKGFFGRRSSGDHEYRPAVEPVERLEDRTVLRFTVTALTSEEEWAPAPRFNAAAAGSENTVGLRLLDPVGQRYYYPLTTPEEDDLRLGSVWEGPTRPGAH